MYEYKLLKKYIECNFFMRKAFAVKDFFVLLQKQVISYMALSHRKISPSRIEQRMIFASSCVESAARKRNVSTTAMYRRMKSVGLVEGYILKFYDGLHTQSREYVTDNVLGALDIWESKKGLKQ